MIFVDLSKGRTLGEILRPTRVQESNWRASERLRLKYWEGSTSWMSIDLVQWSRPLCLWTCSPRARCLASYNGAEG